MKMIRLSLAKFRAKIDRILRLGHLWFREESLHAVKLRVKHIFSIICVVIIMIMIIIIMIIKIMLMMMIVIIIVLLILIIIILIIII